MKPAHLDNITVEYEITGAGEPILFIHGAFIADAFRPLVAEPALSDRYRLVTYHRRGYMGSSRSVDPTSLQQQAADCQALLRHVGVERVHVVGHSFGGCIALQLALEAPKIVHSLALLEPALMVGESAKGYRQALARGKERYRELGAQVVVDEFLEARWPGYRDRLDQILPGAFDQAVTDAATWFERDLPAGLHWRFGEVEARRITQPVLSVLGGDSDALWSRFGETHQWLLGWLPHGEGFVLPSTTHFLQLQDSSGMAEALTAFFARHPMAT